MIATVRLVIITALRDRLFTGLILLLALVSALAMFMGGAALTEQLQTAQAFAAGGGRVVLVFGLTVFAAFHIQALFETREVEAILARSISRARFVVAYWLGLAVVAAIVSTAFSLLVLVASGFYVGAVMWSASLLAECVLVMAVATLAGLMLERATPTVMFVLGFYALARLMGFFIGIRQVVDDSPTQRIVNGTLDLITLFIPRLDLFAQTRWIIYGPGRDDVVFVAVQSALFLALVLMAAIFDLSRKQF